MVMVCIERQRAGADGAQLSPTEKGQGIEDPQAWHQDLELVHALQGQLALGLKGGALQLAIGLEAPLPAQALFA